MGQVNAPIPAAAQEPLDSVSANLRQLLILGRRHVCPRRYCRAIRRGPGEDRVDGIASADFGEYFIGTRERGAIGRCASEEGSIAKLAVECAHDL